MKLNPALKLTLKLLGVLIILFLAAVGLRSLLADTPAATSNRLMSYFDPATSLTGYTVNYHPGKTEYIEWYDESKPSVLTQGDPLARKLRIIGGGSYQVSTTRGVVIDFYTILQSDDGKLFFSGNDFYQVRQVISGMPAAEADKPVKFTCFPVVKLDPSEAVKAAQANAFQRLRDTR